MVVGAICYSLWIWGFLIPDYYHTQKKLLKGEEPDEWYLDKDFVRSVLVVTSAINGIGAGLMWVASGTLISHLACFENKGFFNGFYISCLMSSRLFSNIIADMILDMLNEGKI